MKKQLLVYLVILSFFYGFKTSKSIELSTSDTIYIKYKSKIEFFSVEANKNYAMEDKVYLAYRNGQLVIKTQVPNYDIVRSATDSNTFIIMDSVPVSMAYNYAYFNLKDSSAYYYNHQSLNEKGRKVNADSLFKSKITILPIIIDPKDDSLVSVLELGDVRTETYFTINKPDDTYFDSTIIRFDKTLNAVPFSFSKTLDASRGMKLVQIVGVYNPTIDKASGIKVPRREFRFEIQLNEPDKDEFLEGLFR